MLSIDKDRRITLSTSALEATRGDMLRDPQLVFTGAEEMARQFREKVAAACRATKPSALAKKKGKH